ncbi:hypothetical protein DO021_19605 [Desulfobacter hydrogenophilus]|uniref:Uncharacterized protein n=1 Tax=Desulfobacter hydrogenophilus TaxID=2291 RepID=A0A328FB18_9BACT|nr:hypothetical protein [Desulfobacter hydrogenophilus]NDY73978.1 hypothetical protein [Desulfobacter hydrogenophilus]QBH14323.1 hypothetical protein EYB58_16205 [Desulfobacter hydrogenophilus]RAM00325.1 hypothetical protein DO021_19605 [Desulfobacter hydrogenophilus]
MHNAKISTLTVQVKTVRAPGHDQMLFAMKLAASQGTLRAGALLSKNSSGLGVPYVDLTQVLGTGDGSTKAYTGTVTGAPLEPGSVVVTDGVEAFADDGMGRLTGDAGGSGTINCKTGAISVSFNVNVVNETDITVTSSRKIAGVLDMDVDTTKAIDGTLVVHGTVKEAMLTKGTTPVACVAADFERLRDRGIYPV